MRYLTVATTALLLLMAAAPTDVSAACQKRGALTECRLTTSLTATGTERTVREFGGDDFGPAFRINLEWWPDDIDPTGSWCNLKVWYADDPAQSYDQISIAHTTPWTLTGNSTSHLLTAGQEGLLIERAAAWLTPTSCTGAVVVTYAKRIESLFR